MGYYRESGFQFSVRIPFAIKWLLIANGAVFLLQNIFAMAFGIPLSAFLGLNATGVFHGMIWQPVTYMFLHAHLFHLLFNMFALWMFGSDVERAWGSRSFLYYYFFTGVGAGFLSLLASLSGNVTTIGASGAIFGILVAFGMMFPDRIVLVFFLFPMRAKHFVILFAGIELWVTLTAGPHAGGVARLAHIGGALLGYLYIRYGDLIRHSLPRIRLNLGSARRKDEEDWLHFMNEEVDPILDKISRQGLHSLTRRERKILKRARGRRRG